MSQKRPKQLMARHEVFLNLEAVVRLSLGFGRGGYYPAKQFPSGTARWRDGQSPQTDDVAFSGDGTGED